MVEEASSKRERGPSAVIVASLVTLLTSSTNCIGILLVTNSRTRCTLLINPLTLGEDPHLPFTQAQCQQLLAMLSSQASLSLSQPQMPIQIVCQSQDASSSTPHQAASAISQFMLGNTPRYLSTMPKHSIFSNQTVNKTRFSHNTWILDTSATDHMVHSLCKFTSITSSISTYIHLPNGEKALATHIGTVQISKSLLLTDVLCIPSFSFNLISISKLTNSPSCCVFFLSHLCFIQDLVAWKRIGLGRKKNGLYFLQVSDNAETFSSLLPSIAAHTAVINKSVFYVWHHRLGHPSPSRLSLLKNVINDLVIPSANEHCKVCHISKQKRYLLQLLSILLLCLLI
jgi:hypothetical protein